MERIVNKARSFAEAEKWDQLQYQTMTGAERMKVARAIKDRVYPGKVPDVRECHTSQKTR